MSFLRRLALRAVIAAKKPSVIAAAGPLQHGVGCQDGANKMIKSSQCFAEADQSLVLVALDLKAAFQNVSRQLHAAQLGQHDPDLATVFSRWYTGTTTHRTHHDGSYAHIQASSGIDQGCPLSPCGFAAAVDPISQYILTQTQRTLDSGAMLWAYLDDCTSGSSLNTFQPASTWQAPPAPSTLNSNLLRYRSGQPLAPAPSRLLTWTKPSQH